MALNDYLTQAADNIKLNFNFTKDGIVDYLIKNDTGLKDYFSENTPERERALLRKNLEGKVSLALEKYQDELGGLARKSVSRGTMSLALLNDLYAYVSNVPIANVTGLGYSLFALKTAAELPAVYRYMKKSKDWYGALWHYAMKPINYLIPVIGAGIEAGSFERMVKRRVMNESKLSFIKENGDYHAFEDKIREKLQTPICDAIEVETKTQNPNSKTIEYSTSA